MKAILRVLVLVLAAGAAYFTLLDRRGLYGLVDTAQEVFQAVAENYTKK